MAVCPQQKIMSYTEDMLHLKTGLSNKIWEVVLKAENNAENVKTVKKAITELQGVFDKINSGNNTTVSYQSMLEQLQNIANTVSANPELKCAMEVWEKYYDMEVNPYLSLCHIFELAKLDNLIIPHYTLGEDYLKKSNRPEVEILSKVGYEKKLKMLVIGGMTQIVCGLLVYYDLAKQLQPLKYIQSLL